MSVARSFTGIGLLVCALAVTGCAPGPAAGGGVAGGGEGADSTARPTTAPTPSDPRTSPAVAAPASPVACLTGTWLADNEFFLAGMREFGDEVQDVTGSVVVEFAADGAMTTDYRDWRIHAAAEGVEVTVHRHGLDTGTYSATEATLSFADIAIGSTLVVGGAGFEMSIEPEPTSVDDAPYTCDASTAEVRAPEGVLVLHRR